MTLYDHEIREPLFDWLEEKYGVVRILEEKQMGKARADALMVTPEELVRIQKRNHLPAYKEKSKKFVQEKILLKIPEEQLHREISRELFERDYTLIEEELEEYRQQK